MKKKIPEWWFSKKAKWKSLKKEREAYRATEAGRAIRKEKFTHLDLKRYHAAVDALSKKFPEDVYLKIYEAAIWGDWGQCLSPALEKKYKATAVKTIKKTFGKLKGQPFFVRSIARNEYYYHSSQYLKQYQLGIEEMRAGYSNHFSPGVGGAMYAFELARRGKFKKSRDFGSRAVRHWETSKDPCEWGGAFYCLALATAGREEDARKAFSKVLKINKYSRTKHKAYYDRRKKDLEFAIKAGKK